MGIAPNLLIQGGATGFQAFSQYKAGQAAEESYKEEAAEVIRQSEFSQQQSLREQGNVVRQGIREKGQVKGRAAKAGVKSGGSVKGQIANIGSLVERRLEDINIVESEKGRRAMMNARQLKKQGRRLGKAGKIRAAGTGLLGALDINEQVTEVGGFANIFRDRRTPLVSTFRGKTPA